MITQINKVAGINVLGELTLYQKKAKDLENVNNIIVHNLRGIASNIKMLTEMLMATYVHRKEESTALARSFSLEQGLSSIDDSSSSLLNMLGNLMKGIEADDTTPELDNCDIAEIVHDITIQLNGFIHEKRARIRLRLGTTHIEYPRHYLESLLYNLISNSLKYSREDVPPEITIISYDDCGRTILVIKDNGLGIDMEQHGDKIFNFGQVFHPGHDSKGVGLYITRKQIESLGGSINVRSKINEGCEFIITF
jgi:signal transduction histidine kinase